MRVLTVRQPWAWAIIHGGKDVENRVRNIAGTYRGPVAIHAGLAIDKISVEVHRELNAADSRYADKLSAGVIIGVVDLVDVHNPIDVLFAPTADTDGGTCSPWAEPGAHHLELASPRPLRTPIPYRGALGLRTLPADVEAAIREQVG